MMPTSRREFFALLASSPLYAQDQGVITEASQAISVMDFEPACRKALPPAHYGYLATGVEDDATLRANREGFARVHLKPRRLRGVAEVDLSIKLFGARHETPILLAPIGNQKAFHPEGELPVARASRSRKTMQVLSTVANTSVEDLARERGAPPWYQLYATNNWSVTERLVHRAEDAGCPVLFWTVDTNTGRRTDTLERMKRLDTRKCSVCHSSAPNSIFQRKPMFDGVDTSQLKMVNPAHTWKELPALKKLSRMKVLVKGIETAEDAVMALDNGADGIVVSNHGGRADESGLGTIDVLPEIAEAVRGRTPIIIDGGFRRGSDIFKALALGASAVGIGRPYVWASSAFGQAGVESVLDMLRAELELVMKQCGTANTAAITRDYVSLRR